MYDVLPCWKHVVSEEDDSAHVPHQLWRFFAREMIPRVDVGDSR